MRALVLGYGRMGGFHRRILTDLGYEVTTVDPSPAAGADHVSTPVGPVFEVVCISTPIEHLAEQAAAWIGRTDHLLIEKPMAATLQEAMELQDKLAGQPTAVGYVERFNPRVRELRAALPTAGAVRSATFTRWNDRPSADVPTDLTSHDVDLARHLGIDVAVFDSRAGSAIKRRTISVECESGTLTADLFDHSSNPLHAQWHTFLSARDGCATPADAVATLLDLDSAALATAA